TSTTELYTLSLHDALPISGSMTTTPATVFILRPRPARKVAGGVHAAEFVETQAVLHLPPTRALVPIGSHHDMSMPLSAPRAGSRSEEHTSELQSLAYLVCR